jgi:hypothetical protein
MILNDEIDEILNEGRTCLKHYFQGIREAIKLNIL